MFDTSKPSRTTKPGAKYYKNGYALPVFIAADLLQSRQHQAWFEQVKQLVDLPDELFNRYYLPLIDGFAEYVQLLPSKTGAYLGSLLNISLSRSLAALVELQKQTKAKSSRLQQAKMDPQVAYAVFSAALLHGIAAAVVNQVVTLCDSEGYFLANWDPYQGTMASQGAKTYKLYPIEGVYGSIEYDLTVLLARQLMPKEGFIWICSDTDLLIDWLNALANQLEFAGKIISVLSLIKEFEKKQGHEFDNLLPKDDFEQIETPNVEHGEAFYRWLKNEIANGNLKFNSADAFIHRFEKGVFLEYPGLVKEFNKVYGKNVPMNIVFVQFGNLFGIVRQSGQDFAFAHFLGGSNNASGNFLGGPYSSKQDALHKGILVNTHLIFDKAPPMSIQAKLVENNQPALQQTAEISPRSNPGSNLTRS